MIVIKNVPLSEKKALETHGFVHDVELSQYVTDDNIIYYDIILKLDVQILTKKYGIVLFRPLWPTDTHYMNEFMFMKVIII